MPIPEPLDSMPELEPGLVFYWYAFWELSTDRQIGMSEGPIPWSSMHRWCQYHEILGDEFDRFVIMIKHMDAAYLKHRSKASKKSIAKAGSQNPDQKKQFMKTKQR